MHNELDATNMRIGVIVVRDFKDHTDEHLMPLIDNLLSMGCHQQNIVVRTIPSIFDVVIATQFFAEYTDVDGVVILAPENKIMGTLSVMNGIVQIQVQWNMVVEIGGAECARNIVDMITLQNEMEINAVDHKVRHNFS